MENSNISPIQSEETKAKTQWVLDADGIWSKRLLTPFEGHGEMTVVMELSSYHKESQFRGVIHLFVTSPIDAECLFLKLKGYQQSKYTISQTAEQNPSKTNKKTVPVNESYTKSIAGSGNPNPKSYSEFYSYKFVMHKFKKDHILEKGNYQFPFVFT